MFNSLRRLRRSRALPYVLAVVLINAAILSVMRYDSDIVLSTVADKFKQLQYKSTGSPDNDVDTQFALENLFNTRILHSYTVPSAFHGSKPTVYDYDPRLTNAVFLHQITKQFELSGGDLASMDMPFSWYDWADLTVLNGYIELPPEDKPTCEYVCGKNLRKSETRQLQQKIDKLHEAQADAPQLQDDGEDEIKRPERLQQQPQNALDKEEEPLKDEETQNNGMPVILPKRDLARRARVRAGREAKNCAKYCITDTSPNQPGFRVFKQLYKGKPNLKTVQGHSYLYSEAPSPNSLVFVTPKGNLQVNVKSNEEENDKQVFNMVNSGYVEDLINDRSTKLDIMAIYKEFLEKLPISKPNELDFQYRVDLTPEQFRFDAPDYLATHTAKTRYEKAFQDSLKFSLNTRDEMLKKYLNEAMMSGGTGVNGGHFDIRFFNDGKYSEEERQAVLTRLLRTWFGLTSNAGILSWVAHGALLAHDFSGVGFPWDDDLDIQMPFKDFARLAELYNSSVIVEDPEFGYGRYYLDTTNSITHRSKGNGLNRIDGRFIDVNTGFFIDITALGSAPNSLPIRYLKQFNTLPEDYKVEAKDPNVIIDDYYTELTPEEVKELGKDDTAFADRAKKLKEMRKTRPTGLTKDRTLEEKWDINNRLHIYNCRNEHTYVLEELSPLRMTYQDKVRVYIPNTAASLVEREYKKQPKLTADYRGYFFLPALRTWNEFGNVLKHFGVEVFRDLNTAQEKDMIGMLEDQEALKVYRRTWEASVLREKEKKIIIDPYIPDDEREPLLKELMLGRQFYPLYKDMFQSKLEKKALEGVDTSGVLKKEKEAMIQQLKKEYLKQVDYTFGDDTLQLTHDFNKVSRTLKDDMYDYLHNDFDPDVQAKIIALQKNIDEVSRKGQDKLTQSDREGIAQWQKDIMALHAKKVKMDEAEEEEKKKKAATAANAEV